MSRLIIIKCIMLLLFLWSCNTVPKLQEIPVDTQKTSVCSLTTIASSVEAINLEFTDQSMLSDRIQRILFDDSFILIYDYRLKSVLLFERNGKFIRQIGRVGQGPGEYTAIVDMAADFKRKHIYVSTTPIKIICYDFDGKFISTLSIRGARSLCFANGELIALSEYFNEGEKVHRSFRSVLYRINPDSHLFDSIPIRTIDNPRVAWTRPFNDFVIPVDGDFRVYYPELNVEASLRDTLFRVVKNELVPELRLNFGTNGLTSNGERDLHLLNIYRNNRFVFSYFYTLPFVQHRFVYDMKEQKGYCFTDGFLDDIHATGTIDIRPLVSNPEWFYYTVFPEDDQDDRNPVLYIGKYKN